MVFQSYALFPHMTVIENVRYGLRFSGFARKEVADRADAGLELVGLAGFGERLPSQLSGGQQQRVAVARALVLEPQVLLFDEPLSNLDAKLRRRVREEIRDIQTKLGLTVVYVTHDQEEALAVSDRIIVMNNARIAQDGTPRELYDAPASTFVADFIGEANIFDCVGRSGRQRQGRGAARAADARCAGRRRPTRSRQARRAAGPHRAASSRRHAEHAARPAADKVTYVGSHLEFVVGTEFGEVFVVSPDVDAPFAAGEPVGLGFAERGPVLIRD